MVEKHLHKHVASVFGIAAFLDLKGEGRPHPTARNGFTLGS